MSRLTETISTCLPKDVADALRAFAESHYLTESAALRLVAINFFAVPHSTLNIPTPTQPNFPRGD